MAERWQMKITLSFALITVIQVRYLKWELFLSPRSPRVEEGVWITCPQFRNMLLCGPVPVRKVLVIVGGRSVVRSALRVIKRLPLSLCELFARWRGRAVFGLQWFRFRFLMDHGLDPAHPDRDNKSAVGQADFVVVEPFALDKTVIDQPD